MIIYKATNKINGKIYIGQTVNTLQHRANQHLQETKNSTRKNTYFHNAIQKYGFENFIFIEIDHASNIEELNIKEQYWIEYYNSTNKTIGYNLDSGGVNCYKSESTKRKIGDTTIAKWNNPETAQKMREGLAKATEVWVQQCENNKVDWECPVCGKKLKLAPHEARKRKTCSLECTGKTQSNAIHLRQISQAKHERNLASKSILKLKILEWCQDNQELILNCPYNKITPTLKPMLKYFNIQDIRNIFICFGVKNRKELLTYLKNYLISENIC